MDYHNIELDKMYIKQRLHTSLDLFLTMNNIDVHHANQIYHTGG